METIKLNITIDKDWLEATWTKEIATINEVEKEIEVDGELIQEIVQEESVTTEQLHCESLSGHPEHIAMLETLAVEFGTSLDEYADVIAQAKEAFIMPTAEELLAYELDQKLQEANGYLAQTDWVNTYKIRHDLGLELIQEDSSKWVIISKREEYIAFLKGI